MENTGSTTEVHKVWGEGENGGFSSEREKLIWTFCVVVISRCLHWGIIDIDLLKERHFFNIIELNGLTDELIDEGLERLCKTSFIQRIGKTRRVWSLAKVLHANNKYPLGDIVTPDENDKDLMVAVRSLKPYTTP